MHAATTKKMIDDHRIDRDNLLVSCRPAQHSTGQLVAMIAGDFRKVKAFLLLAGFGPINAIPREWRGACAIRGGGFPVRRRAGSAPAGPNWPSRLLRAMPSHAMGEEAAKTLGRSALIKIKISILCRGGGYGRSISCFCALLGRTINAEIERSAISPRMKRRWTQRGLASIGHNQRKWTAAPATDYLGFCEA
jgi:hypothetical protein